MRGLSKRSGKRTVCGIVSLFNANASVVEKALSLNRFYDAEAFVFHSKIGPFTNNAG
jgi:hypothetical protein